MKITVYYVVRVYKDGNARIDSGPYSTIVDAIDARDEEYWNANDYQIFESSIEGVLV